MTNRRLKLSASLASRINLSRSPENGCTALDSIHAGIFGQVRAHARPGDGHKAYLEAVEGAFGADVDYAMLIKMYGPTSEAAN